VPELNRIYRQYRDRAAFYVVYISEAHPVDRWQLNSNVKDDVLVKNTTTGEERLDVAGVCVRKLGIEIPAVVDEIDNRVEQAYTGWPDRLYVIDTEGRVALKSAAGPFGFKPEDVETTLKQLLP
jgi:type I thyroxine 5'-deiodinase